MRSLPAIAAAILAVGSAVAEQPNGAERQAQVPPYYPAHIHADSLPRPAVDIENSCR